MMKASELVSKALDIAKNDKTLYVMGCFGAPMTAANKKRYTTNHSYNKAAVRVKMINAASEDTFGFDCVNLIKGILWGWCGDKSKTYGGAKYASNGVPDIGADKMITTCPDASASGWASMEPGEVVWNLQLQSRHFSHLLFLLPQGQLAAQEGLVQKELDNVIEDYIVFILDERGLFRVKYAPLRIREHFNEIINLLIILFGDGISNPKRGRNHRSQDH